MGNDAARRRPPRRAQDRLYGPDRLGAPDARPTHIFAKGAKGAGFKVVIAGAGGAAHLPGMTAAMTALPVLGVPIKTTALGGQDSLFSIVQMPAGVPVGTLAIGKPGAINAALLAAAILSLSESGDRSQAFGLADGTNQGGGRRAVAGGLTGAIRPCSRCDDWEFSEAASTADARIGGG